jgi:hypothetical protein
VSGLASKLLATVSGGFTLKPDVTVFDGLASKLVAMVFSSLASKLVVMVSPGLASKPAVIFLVEPQNQGGRGFLSLGLKTGSSALVIWTLKSPRQFSNLGLKIKWALVCWLRHKIDGGRSARNKRRDLAAFLRVEANLARVFQSGLKTGGGAMAGGAHGTIVEVASEAS